MYNNPEAISDIADTVARQLGWREMDSRKIGMREIQNLIRATIKPNDKDLLGNRLRIAEEVISALRRIYPIVR